MDVNKIKLTAFTNTQEIILPLDLQWDLLNREDSVVAEENNIIEQVIGQPPNYELVRFSRRPQDLSIISNGYGGLTQVVHRFNFYSGSTDTWENSYLTRFNENEVRFFSNSYKNSFFKFDLYDSTLPQSQRIYLSLILETSQSASETGLTPDGCGTYRFYSLFNFQVVRFTYLDCCGLEQLFVVPAGLPFGNPQSSLLFCATIGSTATATTLNAGGEVVTTFTLTSDLAPNLAASLGVYRFFDSNGQFQTCNCTNSDFPLFYKPEFRLDHYGDQKGYYIHWYEDETLLNISELFMRVKFFDGNTGTYTTFTVNPQSSYVNPYRLPNDEFYIRVRFFYPQRWYELIDIISGNILPICNWYEYTNPPLT